MLNGTTTTDIAEQLSQTATDLGQRLRQHEPQLRRLGIGLPQGALDKLDTVREDLSKVATKLKDQDMELTQLRVLSDTAELINSTLDLDTVLNSVMDEVIQLVGAERGYIMLRNPQTGLLEARVTRRLEANSELNEEFIVSRTIVERVAQTGEAIITTNAQEDDRFSGQESIVGFALRSIICVPLVFREQVLGAVYCDNRIRDGLFRQREKRLLSAFANQSAIAIQNAQLFDQIKRTLQEITDFKILLDNTLASITSGIITTDTKGIVTTFSDASERIFMQTEAETLERALPDALPMIYSHIREAWERACNEDGSFGVEVETEFAARGEVNLTLKLSPLKGADNVTLGVAITVDDMTELKKRDATLAAVRRYLPPAMVDNIKSIEQLALGGERRHITVLFVETRPFESFPPAMPPVELMESLNNYLTIGSEAIQHHAGLIDKFMGNEIMSIFNTQLNPLENHAWDAVQAALRMAANFRILALYGTDSQHEQAFYRIGIHSGVATLGNVGSSDRREFSAIGDTVNLTKRLQENAHTGQIIISEQTLELCRPFMSDSEWISIKELDPIVVKGRVQKSRIFEIFDSSDN